MHINSANCVGCLLEWEYEWEYRCRENGNLTKSDCWNGTGCELEKSSEWEGMGVKILFSHTSSTLEKVTH